MKLTRNFLAVALNFSLVFSFLSFTTPSVSAQDSTKIALQRGYRTGYSDGYMSGYRDAIENATKSYKRHKDYETADRAYNKDYGIIEDYRDGYRQGFEIGYETGYEKRSFDAAIPSGLAKRGVITPENTVADSTVQTQTSLPETSVDSTETYSTNTASSTDSTTPKQPVIYNQTKYGNSNQTDDAIIVIPKDTELVVELLDEITTEHTEKGEMFQARVVSPYEISGAIIEGRVSKVQKPGRLKRRAEIILSFDRIILSDKRWSNYDAIVTEVLPIKGDNIKRVDTEGTVEGKSSLKKDITKVSAATGTGVVIGAIAGGPVGAAVGAGVGGAFGVGAVVIDRGKHIRIQRNQQLRIKTSYDTKIR